MGRLLRKGNAVKEKNLLSDIYNRILALNDMDKEESSIQTDAILAEIDAVKEKLEKEIAERDRCNGKPWDFSKERLWEVFAENDDFRLIPFGEDVKEDYLKIKIENANDPEHLNNEMRRDLEWEYTKDERAIELLKEYCYKGYGKTVITLFLLKMSEITGKLEFQALVESDNMASQLLMDKLGARLIDIYNYVCFTEEEAEAFENDNLDLITDRMVMLAEQIEVEPKKLLSNVLDYRIFVINLKEK